MKESHGPPSKKEEEKGSNPEATMSQAAELAKMRRKRTVKKNIVEKDLFAKCEALIARERTDETVKEAKVLLQTLMETTEEVRKLDDMVSDLIADDVEFEANETAAYQFLIAAKRMEGEIKALIEPQRIKQETEHRRNQPVKYVYTKRVATTPPAL